MDEYQTVKTLLTDVNIRRDLNRWGFTNQVLNVQDKSQTVYAGKGRLWLVTLPEGKIIVKKQESITIEAANLQRKKLVFPKNYPQVYSINSECLFLEFVDGVSAWDKVIAEESIPLELMVSHMADVHNLSKEQLERGEIDFKLKSYADYCRSKFERHLDKTLGLKFGEAYRDLQREIEGKLKDYDAVEHVDANLLNWFGLIKIDETNNTFSVPHLTLMSMLEYGPLNLSEDEAERLYRLYCNRTSRDFDKFKEVDVYAKVIFHLNKVCREIRNLEKNRDIIDTNKTKGLKRHITILNKSLESLLSSGHDVSKLLQLNDSLTVHCHNRGWL